MNVSNHNILAVLASYPVPRPAFRTASDEKLGVGLGMRLSCTTFIAHYAEDLTVCIEDKGGEVLEYVTYAEHGSKNRSGSYKDKRGS